MKTNKPFFLLIYMVSTLFFTECGTHQSKKPIPPKITMNFSEGTYGYDTRFLADHNIKTVELNDTASGSYVLLSPGYQGRVMTSTAGGSEGLSFGWINYKLIQSGEINSQFNPVGGEERLWLGPEGGIWSIYFPEGKEQLFENWKVPAFIDTDSFEIIAQLKDRVAFKKDFEIINYSGNTLKGSIYRTVNILSENEIEEKLKLALRDSIKFVAYQSENILENTGTTPWNRKNGMLSIWMLSMFRPSPDGVVFIPFKKGSEQELGRRVNSDYFGNIPEDRLNVKENLLFFKVDGKYRSKIGISPQRALPFCGSYDAKNQVLTILWYSSPDIEKGYVNSKWGKQEDPLKGDAVNSYNDGPVADGSIMGPFYEIESSSPAAMLTPREKITHIQQIYHFMGPESQLGIITEKIFGLKLSEIKNAFPR